MDFHQALINAYFEPTELSYKLVCFSKTCARVAPSICTYCFGPLSMSPDSFQLESWATRKEAKEYFCHFFGVVLDFGSKSFSPPAVAVSPNPDYLGNAIAHQFLFFIQTLSLTHTHTHSLSLFHISWSDEHYFKPSVATKSFGSRLQTEEAGNL